MTPMYRRFLGITTIGMTALCCLPMSARAQTARYGNTVNTRFATVSSGPQSALVVDVDDATGRAASDSDKDKLVRSAAANLWTAQGKALQNQLAHLRAAHVLKPGMSIPVSTIILERKNGKLVTPPTTSAGRAVGPSRAFGNGTLTLNFVGFSSANQTQLQNFANLILQRLPLIYGNPATTGTIEVDQVAEEDYTDVQGLTSGAFDASTNKILIPEYRNNPNQIDSMRLALLLNLIHAFHGPLCFQYDAWEQGFARAAASVFLRDANVRSYLGSVGSVYATDPTANYFLSFLSFYDILNQPALGNSTFFPASLKNTTIDATAGKMFLPRLGMSSAAWLKVYIERTDFFLQFNNAYYAAANGNAALAGNVPALRALAKGVLPNGVEGQDFDSWFTQQYILDTSVTVGSKLYATVYPGDVGSDGIQSHAIVLEYFKTSDTGDEALLAGNAYATYLDDTDAVNHLGANAEAVSIQQGEGFLNTQESPSSFDDRRLTMDFVVDQVSTRTYVPCGYSNDFQGVILGPGASAGTVAIQQTTVPQAVAHSASVSVSRAAFGANVDAQINDLGKTTITFTNNGVTQTFHVNTGDGKYYAILRNGSSGGAVTTATHTFTNTTGSNLPQLVSFPVQPLSSSPDTALGLASTDFLLYAWDNGGSAYTPFVPGTPNFPRIEPGRGYWLIIAPQNVSQTNTTVSMTGTAVPTDTDYVVAAPFGWSIIGSPFGTDVPISSIKVQVLQNDPETWDQAVTDGFVIAQPFGFDPTSGTQPTDTLVGTQWKGYWVRSYVPSGMSLLIPGPDAPSRAVTSRSVTHSRATPMVPRKTPKPAWQIHLTAQQDTGGLPYTKTATATLGAADGASRTFDPRLDRELPPTMVASVQIEFNRPDWNGTRSAGGHYVADFRDRSADQNGTWDLRVTTPVNGPATLTWDGVGSAPRRTRLTLIDTVAGTRIPLSSRSSYTWTGEAGKTRAFQVVSQPEQSLPLRVTNFTMVTTRAVGSVGGGMTFGYTLLGDTDATVDVTISTMAGRVLRQLDGGSTVTPTPGRAAGSGSQRAVHWDGKSSDGGGLPVGTYLVTITARGSDGTLARFQRPILIAR